MNQEFDAKDAGVPPFEHAEAVKYYQKNPESLEEGLRILASEVGVFRGRIDLFGVDRKKNLVIIDVTNAHDSARKSEQLKKYKQNLIWMARTVFGLRDLPDIRLMTVRPNESVKDVV